MVSEQAKPFPSYVFMVPLGRFQQRNIVRIGGCQEKFIDRMDGYYFLIMVLRMRALVACGAPLLVAFRLKYEDDNQNEFSVLSASISEKFVL